MHTTHTLLEHFRSFYALNPHDDIKTLMRYFSLFGGTPWRVDYSKNIETLVEEKVLKNYRYIHAEITPLTQSDPKTHKLLTALAQGDAREHSAFKRAQLSREQGEALADTLIDKGLLFVEKPLAKPFDPDEELSYKLYFHTPFMKFWFGCVSPFYKSIKAGDFSEAHTALHKRLHDLEHDIYLLLFRFYLLHEDKKIQKIGSYWDKKHTIDILARLKDETILAASVKTSKSKFKKSELTLLHDTLKASHLEAQSIGLFSKHGFSSELKKLKSPTLKLYTPKHFKQLLDDATSIAYTMKRY